MVHPPAGPDAALCWVFPASSLPPQPLTPRCVIGRAEDCDVRLVGRAVSRHHAEIRYDSEAMLLSDLHSMNGVFLNGVGVTEVAVREGDVLRLGNWVGYLAAHAASGQNPGSITELGHHVWGGAAFARSLEPLRAAARSKLPLTLIGEPGTGKELLARALHAWSGRRGPFRSFNCATLSEAQAARELFGARPRGGRRARAQASTAESAGLLQATEGGTLLLEEVGELSPALQERLLRVHATGRVGLNGTSVPADVRLVVTRHGQHGRAGGPLARALSANGAGLELALPPLRQRVPEIPALFCHFVNVYFRGEPFTLDAELIESLCLYSWPGNVRELEFLARQLVAMHHAAREIGRRDLPRRILDAVKRRAQGLPPGPDADATRPDVVTSAALS